MAHTKAKSAAKNNRESAAKRLGVKVQDGGRISAGEIIVRQRGTHVYPGVGVKRGNDDTLYAATAGTVKFASRRKTSFNGQRKSIKVVNVLTS